MDCPHTSSASFACRLPSPRGLGSAYSRSAASHGAKTILNRFCLFASYSPVAICARANNLEGRVAHITFGSKKKNQPDGVPAIEQVHPTGRAFNQKRYNISVLCRFYFYIIFSIA